MPISNPTNHNDYTSATSQTRCSSSIPGIRGVTKRCFTTNLKLSYLLFKTQDQIFPYLCRFTTVGYALYFYTYSTWKGRSLYLEDLYVMPEFRGNGIGSGLLSKVAEVRMCVRLQLSVLNWNTPARDFYATKGAQDLTVNEGWHSVRFDGQNLDNLANEAPK
uniref:N-acetyltransferase domain-containing protein n=1 Tax=Monopterus albus TaxID=43700 RepID=A0A3Q3IRQ8_MONAL